MKNDANLSKTLSMEGVYISGQFAKTGSGETNSKALFLINRLSCSLKSYDQTRSNSDFFTF